jgi:transposase-like protein
VRSKHFENKARREWWSVHFEAWRRSGLSQRLYCRDHRLTETTFARWLKVLVDDRVLRAKAEFEREKRLERRRRKGKRLSPGKRSRAVRAFWAMHVEALNWSGMSVTHYAMALDISAHSLRHWRDLFAAEEISIDWRARFHPSALPPLSTGLSTGAKEPRAKLPSTTAQGAGRTGERRSNRRHFSAEQKLAIVLETEATGATVAAVARRHDIVTSVIFRWRVQFGFGKERPAKLATVKLTGKENAGAAGACGNALVLQDLLPMPDGMAAIDLPDGRRVFAPVGADPEAVRRHVAEREAGR